MHRSLVLAAAAAATLLTATAANAGGVHWSVGIGLAPVVVSSGPAYYPAPAYYGAPVYPAPVVYPAPRYYPAPVYVAPRVGYAPRPRIWLPPPPPLPRLYAPWRGHDKRHHDGRVDWRR